MPWIVPPPLADRNSPVTFGGNLLPKDPGLIDKEQRVDYATPDFQIWGVTPAPNQRHKAQHVVDEPHPASFAKPMWSTG